VLLILDYGIRVVLYVDAGNNSNNDRNFVARCTACTVCDWQAAGDITYSIVRPTAFFKSWPVNRTGQAGNANGMALFCRVLLGRANVLKTCCECHVMVAV